MGEVLSNKKRKIVCVSSIRDVFLSDQGILCVVVIVVIVVVVVVIVFGPPFFRVSLFSK